MTPAAVPSTAMPTADDSQSIHPMTNHKTDDSTGVRSEKAEATNIEFSRAALAGDEVEFVTQAMSAGTLAAGGEFTTMAEELLSSWHHGAAVLLTTSCTSALELAAMTLGIGPGDIVVVPSFTFPTTASAFARTGARIRFVDIDPITLGMDPASLAASLDDAVTAVVPVHYGGVACDIDGVLQAARNVGAAVIEDNANGIFSTLREQPLGTFGRMSALSFHQTKSLTCGQGGALVLNDPDDVERAEILADKGTNRRGFLRGACSAYTWQLTGSAFALGEAQAAHLLAQLQRRHLILDRRSEIWDRYRLALGPVADRLRLTLPHDPGPKSARHGFYVLVGGEDRRDHILNELNSVGIAATFHYQPLHRSPAGRAVSDGPAHCPTADRISAQILRLPFHNGLSDNDVDRVITALVEACRRHPVQPGPHRGT